jgi:hypothetical protein
MATPVDELRMGRWVLLATLAPFLFFLALEVHMALRFGLGRLRLTDLLAPVFGLVCGAVIAVAARRGDHGYHRSSTALDVEPMTLRLGPRSFARGDLHAGYIIPQPGGAVRVVLRRRWPRADLRVEVPSAELARSLLAALGFDAAHARLRFGRLPSTPVRIAAVVPATALALWLLIGMDQLWAIMLMLIPGWLMSLGIFASVDVGGDGIRLGGLGRDRFIRHMDVASIEDRADLTVVLTLVDGVKVPIQMAHRTHARALVTRMNEVLAARGLTPASASA